MNSYAELIEQPEIARFLETHQGSADAVRRAAGVLAEKPDAVDALRKVLPALRDKLVRVFFSYKKEDEPAANVLVDVLREGSAVKLEITFQGEFTQGISGMKWRHQIRESVRGANWFILLLPNPSDELAWCLFETGLFEAQLSSADRLICIHHPDTEIPSPIEGYQAVAATIPEMEKFLRMVYLEPDPVPGMLPINPVIEKRIPELARRIVDAIRAPKRKIRRDMFVPWISFRLEEAKGLKSKDDLDSATILEANKEALELFGFREVKGTFGELRSTVVEPQGDSRWREELFHVIRKIAQGRTFHPIQAVLQAPDCKIYRPVALAGDRSGPNGPVQTYHLTFSEEVTAPDTAVMPAQLALLATLLRFTFRFRWEVLERFSKAPLSDQDIQQLAVNLTRIEVDWQSRGAIANEGLLDLFPGAQGKRVEEMMEEWHLLRNPSGTGELDVALEARDGAKISALLAKLLPMNQEFLEMGADRFSKMISGGGRPEARALVR